MNTAAAATILCVDDHLSLYPLNESHAASLLKLVNANRNRFRQWLPWVDAMQTEEDFAAHIRRCQRDAESGTDFSFLILLDGEAVGRIGVHYIDARTRCGAIGYWIGESHSGKGLVTKACGAILRLCFGQLALNRMEIKCATGNVRSSAVPKRLGFQKEGVLRQADCVNGNFLDLELWSLLHEEFLAKGEQ